jgi:molybdate transport system substrate-binding protein
MPGGRYIPAPENGLMRTCLTLLCLCSLIPGCERSEDPGAAGSHAPASTEIRVAAAANLKMALDDLAADFQKANPGIQLKLTYGSSGNLYSQLVNRAPFDLFFSADTQYPQRLVDAGLVETDAVFVYAIGQIALWLPNRAELDLEALGLKCLTDASIRTIAIANPRHAPYGRAAEAALKQFGLYQQVQSRLVMAENIAQATQFVETGAADAGIIALSLALAPAMGDKGRHWVIPPEAYPLLEQAAVILPWSDQPESASRLKAYVLGSEGRAILQRYGFSPPGD